MEYYKSASGAVYAYDSDQVALGLADDKTKMSQDCVAEHIAKPPTPEQLQAQIDADARAYLLSTDWYVTRWQEKGTAIPVEISVERDYARARVVN